MDESIPANEQSTEFVLARTREWLERLVIGEGLCPFARKPYQAGLLRLQVSLAESPARLRCDLADELRLLAAAARTTVETTVLIHPRTLLDFAEFNDFLDVVDACIAEQELEGVIQVASLHPDYRFSGTDHTDVSNASNRSPFPTLHLLREESVSEALAQFEGDPAEIPKRNIALLESLGWEGVAARLGRRRES